MQFLSGPPFEPLARASFFNKTKKALFLLAMATAKRVSELQALSFSVSFQGEDLVLYYDPFFRAKTESAANPLPRSVIVPSLSDFAGDLPERVQCPVRAIKFLRKAARSASYIPSRLFVSPQNPERAMSKNAISFYLRQLIIDSGAVSSSRPPRAHDIRGIATSLIYYSNLSLSNLMQVATWKSNRVFASRYLKEGWGKALFRLLFAYIGGRRAISTRFILPTQNPRFLPVVPLDCWLVLRDYLVLIYLMLWFFLPFFG